MKISDLDSADSSSAHQGGTPVLKSGQKAKNKKEGRGWHHHSRAPRRRSMGQGE
jgi:hypothetical protein